MKVLILGGNGFIGTNLAACLKSEDYEVYSFDYMEPRVKLQGVKYIQGNFFDNKILKKIVKNMDVIFHAISTINPGNSNEKYMDGYTKDFIQTIKLCQLVEKEGSKLIFLSSGGTVYGNPKLFPISEDVVPHPINHYGNVKLCIENMMLTFAYQNKIRVTITRISNPYGPGQDYTKGVGFVDAALKCALDNNTLEIWGDGNNIRDYIYIDDVCKMLISLIHDVNWESDIVNISSGVGTSINEIIDIIRMNGMTLDVVYRKPRSIDADKIVLDNFKIQSIYKKNLISIEQGINKYSTYIKEMHIREEMR